MKYLRWDESVQDKIKCCIANGERLGIDFLVDIPRGYSSDQNGIFWRDIEFFRENWKDRSVQMTRLISASSHSVIDCGCGSGNLRDYIDDRDYIGIDYCSRTGVNNLICDFNRDTFPDITADTIIVAGCLEYIRPYERFIADICSHAMKEIIISYCVIELWMDFEARKLKGHQNFLDTSSLLKLFKIHSVQLVHSEFWTENVPIFKFVKGKV